MRRISFKLIPNFERYRIYSDGRVWDSQKEKFCGYRHTSNGYLQVSFPDDRGKLKTFYVHRLVAQAFCYNDDPEHKVEVDHIDTIKDHNEASNLRWVTHTENNNNPLTRQHKSEAVMGENNPFYDKHHSDKTKAKISASTSGEKNHNYGTHLSEERKAQLRKPKSEEHKANLRKAKKWYRSLIDGHLVPLNVLSGMINRGTTTLNEWELIEN